MDKKCYVRRTCVRSRRTKKIKKANINLENWINVRICVLDTIGNVSDSFKFVSISQSKNV